MRAAGADRMPLRLTDVANQLWTDVENAKHAPHLTDLDLKPLEDRVAAYRTAAALFDAELTQAERSGDLAMLDPLEARAMRARDVFWMPDGLYYNPVWHTIDRYQSSLPELYFAAYEPRDRDAHVKAALDRLIDAVNRAIVLVS